VNNKNVYLIGNLCIDLIISRYKQLPQWGQEVTGSTHRIVNSGQTVYSATALAHLGRSTMVSGYLGDDEFGSSICQYLDSHSIGSDDIEIVQDGQTALTIAVIREDGERAFISHFGCQGSLEKQFILRRIERINAASAVGLLGVFNLPGFSFNRLSPFWEEWRKAGKITLLDTGWDPGGWPNQTVDELTGFLANTSIFMPNIDEAKAITGFSDPEKAGKVLLDAGVGCVVVKLGKKGSLGFRMDEVVYQEPLPADVVDAVGAGDVFNAGFLNAHLEGKNLSSCLLFGTAAATHYIARSTDRFPSPEDLDYQIQTNT
jgi:sugar/nucleoside kinase (ribokinase family)